MVSQKKIKKTPIVRENTTNLKMYSPKNAVAVPMTVPRQSWVLVTNTKVKKMPRDYAAEYKTAKKNKTKSYMHKFTRAAKNARNNNNKARRRLQIPVGDPREVDHRVPQSRGGSNSRANIRAISRKTNRIKGNS